MSDTRGFVGSRPVNLTTGKSSGGGSVRQSRPVAAGPNESIAGYMAAGVESWHFNPRVVVGCILSLSPAHQQRIGRIVFHLIRSWNEMAGHGHGPENPLYPEYMMARKMMANLSNEEIASLTRS